MEKRTGQLVCQHLEKVSMTAIEKHQDIIKQFIRNRHGIYALYNKNKLIYVGLATDLRRRLKHHLHDRHAKSWNRFSVYLTIGDDKLKELETLTLRISNPTNNIQTGKFLRSEDLKKKFKNRIKQKQKEELINIFEEDIEEDIKQETTKKSNTIKTTGRKPVLSDYFSHPMKIKMKLKNKTYYGKVLKNGIIVVNKRRFNSPSLAGRYICKKYTPDGWYVWKYERAPGEWVLINELRK